MTEQGNRGSAGTRVRYAIAAGQAGYTTGFPVGGITVRVTPREVP
jgi:hypothetical protein